VPRRSSLLKTAFVKFYPPQAMKDLDEHKNTKFLSSIPLTTESGEVILDEVEFMALSRLKQVWRSYRRGGEE
jgi:hypothetical protein